MKSLLLTVLFCVLAFPVNAEILESEDDYNRLAAKFHGKNYMAVVGLSPWGELVTCIALFDGEDLFGMEVRNKKNLPVQVYLMVGDELTLVWQCPKLSQLIKDRGI